MKSTSSYATKLSKHEELKKPPLSKPEIALSKKSVLSEKENLYFRLKLQMREETAFMYDSSHNKISLQQLLNSGCLEHVDFATDDINDDDNFGELHDKTSQMISRISLRDVVEDDTSSVEV